MATDYSDDQRPSPTDEVREYDTPAKRTFVLTITTDYPDGEQAARDGAHKVVEQIGWGDDNTSSFELTEIHDDGTASYLAGWELEPGESEPYCNHDAAAVVNGVCECGTSIATCRHCGRRIVRIEEAGKWVDPNATGDDSIWRETCDSHDTFTAEHEPEDV